jgi:hypothetical protein
METVVFDILTGDDDLAPVLFTMGTFCAHLKRLVLVNIIKYLKPISFNESNLILKHFRYLYCSLFCSLLYHY